MIKKIIQRIKSRNLEFRKHPISKDHRIKALWRYILFHLLIQIRPEIKYKWIDNLVFYAGKDDGGIVGNIYCGLYEFYESMFVLHFLRSEDLFLDIGANVGHYSLLASGIKKCNSISIEPVPGTFQKLTKHLRINNLTDKVLALNIGVADKSSSLFFSTDKGTMNRIVNSDYKNSVEIQVDIVDKICHKKNVSLMKIDVEGYEKFVLEGSQSILKNNNLKAIIVEINFSNKFYGIQNEKVSDILINCGFLPFKYDPFTRKLIKLDSYNKEQFNTLFIRDLKFVSYRLNNSIKINVWNKSI